MPIHTSEMAKVILTVDDSTSIRQMVKFTLTGAGYTVIEAVDGRDALTKLTPKVDLVITDLNMPNLDVFRFSWNLSEGVKPI